MHKEQNNCMGGVNQVDPIGNGEDGVEPYVAH